MRKKQAKPAQPAKAEKTKKAAAKRRPRAKAKPALKPEVFGLHNLQVPRGAHKKRKLLGRGPGSGHGKTSTRGSKGQTSRAGRHFYLGFEGGTSPLIRRVPKRGFTSRSRREYQIVNLKDLNRIKDALINPQVLKQGGLIKDKDKPVKILGEGELKQAFSVQAHAFSKKAQQAITTGGGKAEIIHV